MANQPLTDQEIEQIFSGVVPESRDDIAPVAGLIQALRTDVAMEAPRPSPDLAALLAGRPQPQSAPAPRPRARAVKRLLVAISGLGLSLQLGLSAAAATGAVGAAGLAGVLPEPAQRVFDDVVGRHTADHEGAHAPRKTRPRTTPHGMGRLQPQRPKIELVADDESRRTRETNRRDALRGDQAAATGPRTSQVDDAPERQHADSRSPRDADTDGADRPADDRRDDTRTSRPQEEDYADRDAGDNEREPREPRERRERREADDPDESDADHDEPDEDDEVEVEEDDGLEEEDEIDTDRERDRD